MTDFFKGSDEPALAYIRKRGYVSYSSAKNVRDCAVPSSYSSPAQDFGKELHSRWLEKTVLTKFDKAGEKKLMEMERALDNHSVAWALRINAVTEVEFKQPCYGVTVLGYIDIDNRPDNVADLKTTRLSSIALFAAEMDFLQAALYMKVSGSENFYYIGICKEPPYKVMVFNVREFPQRLLTAQAELRRLLAYIKMKL